MSAAQAGVQLRPARCWTPACAGEENSGAVYAYQSTASPSSTPHRWLFSTNPPRPPALNQHQLAEHLLIRPTTPGPARQLTAAPASGAARSSAIASRTIAVRCDDSRVTGSDEPRENSSP